MIFIFQEYAVPVGTIGRVKLGRQLLQKGGAKAIFGKVVRYHSPKKMVLEACEPNGKPIPGLELPKKYNVKEFEIGKL